MGINNVSAKTVRSNFWICGDSPSRFCDSIWKDPSIMKFVPEGGLNSMIVEDIKGVPTHRGLPVSICPNVVSYPLTTGISVENWLAERSCTWGNAAGLPGDDGYGGARSTMLAAIKVLYVLGFRNIYLLGCDFKMELGKQNYAFPQERSPGAVGNNNRTYEILNERFKQLRPKFEAAGLWVYNCSPDSHLEAFERLTYEQALAQAKENFPDEIITLGRYDTVFSSAPKFTAPHVSPRSAMRQAGPRPAVRQAGGYQRTTVPTPRPEGSPPVNKGGFVRAKTFSPR